MASTGLVNDINRLVRQMPVVDIAVGQFRRRAQRRQGIFDIVMLLESRFQTAQNLVGFIHARLMDVDLLEAPRQRPILFKHPAKLLIGR